MPKFMRFAALLALTTAAFSPAHSATAPDGGLLVTHVNSEQWELQFIAGSQARQFTGTVDSSQPFYSSSGGSLEGSDVVAQASPSQLRMALTVEGGRKDVVRFSVPPDAALCLQGSGAPIYVGDTLEDAVAVQAPASLHGIDACGSGATSITSNSNTLTSNKTSATSTTTLTTTSLDGATTLATTATTTARKYHKGHYIALMSYSDTTKTMAASMKPGVKGFMKRYQWKDLEPTKGSYNFSEIQADLTWCAANGMQLILMIEDKTFGSGAINPAPDYIAQYAAKNLGGGYTMIRWDPVVVSRFNALTAALGAKFDSNKAFEGIATQESAPSLSGTTLKAYGYTPEKYRDSYINTLSAAAAAMPTSRVFWFMNFIPGNQTYIASIATAVAPKGVLMGGPDVAPDNYALQTKTYPYYDQFYGKMPLFGQIEGMCYEHLHATSGYSTKYWTMTELYKYAKTDLHVNYMFWVRLPTPAPADSYDYYDALPVIQAYPTLN